MAELKLERTGLKAGRYSARLTVQGQVPVLEFVHQEKVVATAQTSPIDGAADMYDVTAEMPVQVLGDGVQVLALRSAVDGTVLDRLTFLMGDALEGDFRAELALLREEVELLKSAFRRHCVETDTD